MQTEDLIRGLRTESLPDTSDARRRTADQAAQLARPPRQRVRATVLGVLAMLLLLLTPPGQSIAEELGALVGIGDDPSDPLPTSDGSTSKGAVIALGETPSGRQFELGAAPDSGNQEAGKRIICGFISFPGGVDSDNSACGVAAGMSSGPYLRTTAVIGPQGLTDADRLVTMVWSHEPVDSVEIAYEHDGQDQVAATTTGVVPPELLGQDSQVQPTVQLTAAFLPAAILGPPDPVQGPASGATALKEMRDIQGALEQIVVVGRDASGNEVARLRLSEPPGRLADSLALQR